MNSRIEEFERERDRSIKAQLADAHVLNLANRFLIDTAKYKYSYGFSWLGRPIIQFPQDIVAMQEIIWQVQPELIIETGLRALTRITRIRDNKS